MSLNEKGNQLDGNEINDKCKECEKEELTFKIEDIANLQWEEHHTDFTNSIFNPNGQYQALFILNKEKIKKINNVCLPQEWLLSGEDIVDLMINNRYCPFYQCPYQKRLIIDLPSSLIADYNSFYLIANYQEVWNTKLIAFQKFLNRINITNVSLTDINQRYLHKALVKNEFFKRKRYIFHFYIASDPFEKIEMVDSWVKISKICKLEKSEIIFSKEINPIYNLADLNYLDILNKKKFRTILGKELIKDITKEKLRSIKNQKENEKKNVFSENYNEKEEMSYQSSEKDFYLYHKRFKNLKGYLLFRVELKFRWEFLIWFYLPIIFSGIQMLFSFSYVFIYEILERFLPGFNSWVFLVFSMNIFVLLLIAVNWGSFQLLSIFKPNIYRKYFVLLLISVIFLIISLILGPILNPIFKPFWEKVLN